jgi:hypothetical protein
MLNSGTTYCIKPAIVNEESLGIMESHRQNICHSATSDKLNRVVDKALRMVYGSFPGAVLKNVCNGIIGFIAAKFSLDNLYIKLSAGEREPSDMRPTAVTFGSSSRKILD